MDTRRTAAFAILALACAGCLRTNAQGDDRNPNGPGSTNAMPHNASGPGVKDTAGAGTYGGEWWPGPGPAFGFGPTRGAPSGPIFTTEQPGTSGRAPGTGNNGWGGPSDPSGGVTGNGSGPWMP